MQPTEILTVAFAITLSGAVLAILSFISSQLVKLRAQVASAAGLLQRVVQPKRQKQQPQPQMVQYVPQQVQQLAQPDDEYDDDQEVPDIPPWVNGIAQAVGLDAERLALGDPNEMRKAQAVAQNIIQSHKQQTGMEQVI